jgi:hypothetical protein
MNPCFAFLTALPLVALMNLQRLETDLLPSSKPSNSLGNERRNIRLCVTLFLF